MYWYIFLDVFQSSKPDKSGVSLKQSGKEAVDLQVDEVKLSFPTTDLKFIQYNDHAVLNSMRAPFVFGRELTIVYNSSQFSYM